MKQGEFYLVDLDPVVGLEAGGTQLVLVVSNDAINASSLPVTVVSVRPVTPHPPRRFGLLVPAADSGLTADVIVDCLQIRSLDRSRFPDAPSGVLSPARLKDVEQAIHNVVRV